MLCTVRCARCSRCRPSFSSSCTDLRFVVHGAFDRTTVASSRPKLAGLKEAELLTLLEQTFPYIQQPDLRPVALEVFLTWA